MCGIAGKLTPGRAGCGAAVTAACAALAHRGPDSRGLHDEGDVALGMTRLAVIDVATGDQPLHSEDGAVTLVMNGEIYNHHDLRRELRASGHRFATRSDAEVIVHLWEELGPRCVDRLEGMFAFAIWDRRERRLFLARDRVGKKPLYYVEHPNGIAFASEIPALLSDPDTPRDIDPAAIDAYLSNQYVPGDMCAFAAIRKLPPGSTLEWAPGKPARVRRYWRLNYAPKAKLSPAEAAERLRELIEVAVRDRLESEVPLGAFLSGGIDSSVVVAAMARQSTEPVRTFTAVFAERGFDEREHARRIAELYGTEHHELEIGAVDEELLMRIARHFGEPFADPAAVPAFQLAELTRRHVTVCLGGDGGDESFAGYRRYWQIRKTLIADSAPVGLRRAVARKLRTLAGGTEGPGPRRRAARLAGRLAMPSDRRFADLARWFKADDRTRLYGEALRPALAHNPLRAVEAAWLRHAGLDGADRAMAADIDTYLPYDLLVKADITSMAHSLELRSPLLDHRIMEFGATLPPRLKLRGRRGKLVLAQAARPWLPRATLNREKHGFAVPVGTWMRGPLRPLTRELLLDRTARERGLFEPRAVSTALAEHDAGADRTQQLWAMLNLELWFRTCVDAAPAAAPASPVAA